MPRPTAVARALGLLAILVCVPLAGTVLGQSPSLHDLHEAPPAGEWGQWRRHLADRGVVIGLSQLSDLSVVAVGGVRSGHGVLRSLWDVQIDCDADRLFGIHGARLHSHVQLQTGPDGSRDSGDLQVYSNIDGPGGIQLAQFYYQQVAWRGALRFKLGKFDGNEEFALVDAGSTHIHSSFGFAPTIVALPTYPDPAFGAALFLELPADVYLRAAVQDGATQAGSATGPRGPRTLFGSPGDLFAVVEGGQRWGASEQALAGRFGIGAFRHTGTFFDRDDLPVDGVDGFYAVAEQMLWQPASVTHDDDRGLRGFLQYGHADPAASLIESYYGCGVTWSGIGAQRPADQIGVGVAWAQWRSRPGGGVRGGGEVATELFYRAQLTPWFAVMPDIQYLHDPAGRPEVRDALVFTLRFALSF